MSSPASSSYTALRADDEQSDFEPTTATALPPTKWRKKRSRRVGKLDDGESSADGLGSVTTDHEDDDDDDDDGGGIERGALQPISLGTPPPPTTKAGFNRRHKLRVRMPSVYDAVEGRIYSTKDQNLGMFSKPDPFRPRESELQRARRSSTKRAQGALARRQPVPPEEVLFRYAQAPTRYAEHDVYMAHERELLPPLSLSTENNTPLPDNDMLAAIHAYASRFYGTLNRQLESSFRARHPGDELPYPHALPKNSAWGHADERSMDETALLAFGILLEEAGREALGRNGDLVFTEGVDEEEEEEGESGYGDGDEGDEEEEDEEEMRGSSRPRKRRRVGGDADHDNVW